MCFPYGPDVEEALGRGHLLPVWVTEIASSWAIVPG